MPALHQSFFHRLRHLQLAATELVIGMRLAEHSSGGKELMQRGPPAYGNGGGFGLVGRGHGERVFIIAGNSNYRLAIGTLAAAKFDSGFDPDAEKYCRKQKSLWPQWWPLWGAQMGTNPPFTPAWRDHAAPLWAPSRASPATAS